MSAKVQAVKQLRSDVQKRTGTLLGLVECKNLVDEIEAYLMSDSYANELVRPHDEVYELEQQIVELQSIIQSRKFANESLQGEIHRQRGYNEALERILKALLPVQGGTSLRYEDTGMEMPEITLYEDGSASMSKKIH